MDATSRIAGLLAGQNTGFSLQQPFYTDDEIFAQDMALIWHRDWLFAGHDCEIPKTGDFFTWRVGDAEAIVVRGADGRIRAFHNSCRHRGSRICQTHKGSAPKLVCPYHQWTYELDGRLLYAREMGPGFEASKYGLKPVHCESVAGYIFICFAAQAPDFEAYRRVAEPYLAPHRIAEAKVAHETTIVENGNWKLVWENNRECYHCAGSHPELCRTYSDAPTLTGVIGVEGDAEVNAHWARCEAEGLPSKFTLSEDGQHRLMRMPLLRDAESFTMSGKRAVSLPLGGVRSQRPGSLLMFHYPTIWNHCLGDHAVTFRVTPLDAGRTEVTTRWLVHKDAVEGKDYDVKTLTEVWLATNDEDRRLVEQNQLGIRSPAYEPGPYAADHESGVAQFVDWYCNTLRARLPGSSLHVAAE
ncbi:aromatic ring-hydroxylating dioxygenase subunit alpha [Oceanicella sp. SM1341]|uniref:aromatic ring-hydroxylating oxygenase subunit alpha n=1 Tax=Oceanicella sp. SM1341 TaxID=1548889 RepID=UPI000E48FBAA|nr:aromatic ring-hydroxylating dioxygenase subunit alpha [Oceanicella sp. SM1341]